LTRIFIVTTRVELKYSSCRYTKIC